MTLIQALILGIVQGLTEFLPISSSGHLVIGQHLFGLQHADLAFDVSVHLGTLGAVVIFFRSDILAILTALLRWRPLGRGARPAQERPDPGVRLAMLVIMGSVPTALIGLTLKRFEETLFASPLIAGVMLLITGGVLFLTRGPQATARAHPESTRPLAAIRVRDSLLIGIVQGLAVMPGISRSGATIATGLFAGIEPQAAARFSFLLSIPAVAGAALLVLVEAAAQGQVDVTACLAGGLAALIVGYAALAFLVFIIKKGKLYTFAPYCWIVGLAAIALGW
jgi:undecaprenyl-diphosphatase